MDAIKKRFFATSLVNIFFVTRNCSRPLEWRNCRVLYGSQRFAWCPGCLTCSQGRGQQVLLLLMVLVPTTAGPVLLLGAIVPGSRSR
jgi:hypothetical protein